MFFLFGAASSCLAFYVLHSGYGMERTCTDTALHAMHISSTDPRSAPPRFNYIFPSKHPSSTKSRSHRSETFSNHSSQGRGFIVHLAPTPKYYTTPTVHHPSTKRLPFSDDAQLHDWVRHYHIQVYSRERTLTSNHLHLRQAHWPPRSSEP